MVAVFICETDALAQNMRDKCIINALNKYLL